VVREIEATGGRALANFDDIATPEGAQALLDAALAAFGRIVVTTSTAGLYGATSARATTALPSWVWSA